MVKIEEVVGILEEERKVLLDFEAVTQEMLTCGTERLEGMVRERQRLLERLQGLEEELAGLCGEDTENGEAVFAAARGRGEPSEMQGELLEVYRKALELRAVLSRFPESEVQARMRVRLEQEKLLTKIKATNRGSAAKAARFYSAGAGTSGSGRLGRA